MKKNKSTIILILVFFVGLSVMLYPTLSDYVNQLHQSRAVASYAQDVDTMTDADYSAYFDAADAFNAQVAANENALYRPDQLTGYNECWILPAPALWVTSIISKIGGAAHLPQHQRRRIAHRRRPFWRAFSLPVGGESTHAVISAHRGLPMQSCHQPRPAGSGRYLYHHRADRTHLRGGQNLHRAAHRDR